MAPRDTDYERLCALGKAAYPNDAELNPASLDWEFALAVPKLNRHPVSWLLQWAGVRERRPRWDRGLLIIAALLIVPATLIFLAVSQPWSLFRRAGVDAGSAAVIAFVCFASRRPEEWKLQQNIDRYRPASRFVGTVAD
jgi:hypothetical protein